MVQENPHQISEYNQFTYYLILNVSSFTQVLIALFSLLILYLYTKSLQSPSLFFDILLLDTPCSSQSHLLLVLIMNGDHGPKNHNVIHVSSYTQLELILLAFVTSFLNTRHMKVINNKINFREKRRRRLALFYRMKHSWTPHSIPILYFTHILLDFVLI